MGREVRMVPADWQHPKWPDDHYEAHRRGCYIPLHGRGFAQEDADWSEGWAKWQEGLRESYGAGEKWIQIDPKDQGLRYTDYSGARPSPDDYMPDWPSEQRTHLMMYEDTTEGTPISPAFATPEELARWLADNGASSFGSDTATYEQWLPVCKGGWAPSMILDAHGLRSGVAAMADFPAENSPSDMAAAGGLPPLSAPDTPLNPIPFDQGNSSSSVHIEPPMGLAHKAEGSS